MPGGVCEASAFQTRGFRVGGVCLPLANYHNMGPRGLIAPERVHLRDFHAVVRLLTALATQPPDPSSAEARLTHRLDDVLARHRRRL
jgi:putative aminopeptidase FrvX